ncbi:MAG TPA: alpha-amylase family glycosyl hydrolase [Longimicrobiaceae bacterium]|nr:alpha-amylase family glycosyl hydrolase [Longimicrobiaceae bacterium]
MPTFPTRFVYFTGLRREIFRNVRLTGSWDASGRRSDAWTTVPMTPFVAADGCPAYAATVDLEGEAGDELAWGVQLDGPQGIDLWGIMTEVGDTGSTDRRRTFRLRGGAGAGPQEEHYHLTHCRRLGAQKHYRPGAEDPGIQFSVWAPNARAVEVVFGEFRPGDPARQTGHVAEDGTGIDPAVGPFTLRRTSDDPGVWDGTWRTDPDEAALGDFRDFDHRPYMFRVTRDDGSVRYRTDLHSRCQIGKGHVDPGLPDYVDPVHGRGTGRYSGHYTELDGTKGCSVVIDPDTVTRHFEEQVWPEIEFVAADEFWRDEVSHEHPVPRRVEDLVIYELHVGSLGFGTGRPGNFGDALEFLDYLVELGVNAVELLPVMEFKGRAQWGYGTSHYFAMEFSAGGRDQLKHLVRACHRRGIAVILDVVYNHYVHDADRAQWMYDTAGHESNVYYWYEGRASDHAGFEAAAAAYAANPDGRDNPPVPGHGGYVDNLSTGYAPRYHEEMVRKMFIASAVALAEEFHVDGFRFDQTTSIHSYNVLHGDGRKLGHVNVFGAKFLRECARTLRLVRPQLMLTAEDHSGWDRVTRPPEQDGLGFDAVWDAAFYHHLVGDADDRGPADARLIKVAGEGGDGPLALDLFAGALGGSGGRKVVYSESHDEAGNAAGTHRTLVVAAGGEPPVGSIRRYAEARSRWAFAMAALSAGTPMFLMGEEVGATRKMLHDRVLESQEDLLGDRSGGGARMFRYYGDLIRLRLGHEALRSREIEVLHVHERNRVLVFRRWAGAEQFLVAASLNNAPFASGYVVSHPSLGTAGWKEVFNSDAGFYGGEGVGNAGRTLPSQDGRIDLVIPANGVVVFQRAP